MELARQFLAGQVMQGLSPATVERRTWTLMAFLALIKPLRMSEATTAHIERFVAARTAPATRRALLCDLRAFYKWALARDLVEHDPTVIIPTPKVPKRLPTPLTHSELTVAWETANWEMRMILALGASAGLRVSEIAAIRGIDLDTMSRILTVRNGKGGKDRQVPMSHHLVEMFGHVGPGPVFKATSGETISAKIRAHFRACGIDKRPHSLRSTFCTEVARVSGGNMVLVAQLAGHESMVTTQRYVALPALGWDVVDQLYDVA